MVAANLDEHEMMKTGLCIYALLEAYFILVYIQYTFHAFFVACGVNIGAMLLLML